MRRVTAANHPETTVEERLEAVALNALRAAMLERGQELFDGMLVRRYKLLARGLIDVPEASAESARAEVVAQGQSTGTTLLDKLNEASE
jgi:hypothetical protein